MAIGDARPDLIRGAEALRQMDVGTPLEVRPAVDLLLEPQK